MMANNKQGTPETLQKEIINVLYCGKGHRWQLKPPSGPLYSKIRCSLKENISTKRKKKEIPTILMWYACMHAVCIETIWSWKSSCYCCKGNPIIGYNF